MTEVYCVIVPRLFSLILSKDQGLAGVAARTAYCSLDRDIAQRVGTIHMLKKYAARRSGRAEIAHPTPSISKADMEEFLDSLGASGNWELSPVEIRLLSFFEGV
jgi:hypothetical protein